MRRDSMSASDLIHTAAHNFGLPVETVRAAFEPYVHGGEVRFTAACWMVSARVPAASAEPKEVARV